MKKYTHAWLAFKAMERLEHTKLSIVNRRYANSLIDWFKTNRDGVIQGAWYPDAVFHDNSTSHVLKISPTNGGFQPFRKLPNEHLNYLYGKSSMLYETKYTVEKDDNLPDRCEAFSQAIIDSLKMQEMEPKGSAISPSDNHVATIFFILSHYIADAHMPFHCDKRKFSEGADIHARVEGVWEKEVKKFYPIDSAYERFIYGPNNYPVLQSDNSYQQSILYSCEEALKKRPFHITWGNGNSNVWDFMNAVCEYSYLLSYSFIPSGYDHMNVTSANWKKVPGQTLPFQEFSVAILSDAIDSIARVWLRVWRKYQKWEKKQH